MTESEYAEQVQRLSDGLEEERERRRAWRASCVALTRALESLRVGASGLPGSVAQTLCAEIDRLKALL